MASKYEAEIEKLLTDDSFVAWIEKRATDEEAAEWEAWLEDDPARKQVVKQARSLHQDIKFGAIQRPELETELNRLNRGVDQFERAKKRKKQSNVFRLNHGKMYSTVAAAILLLVALVSIVVLLQPGIYPSDSVENTTPEFTTKSTLYGQLKVLTLSDGSTITLNANSSLKYRSYYEGGDLEVWLEGEAYFDIAHKTGADKRAFSVNMPGGRVSVLGTKFNVNTYKHDTEVVLIEGRVNLEMKDSLSKVKDSYMMNPGERSRISRGGDVINTTKVEADLYTAWTQEKLVFDHTPLSKVAQRIEHIYGVEFQLNGYDLKEILVSGSLPNNNLTVFLNTLENMLDRPVTKKEGRIILGEHKSKTNEAEEKK